ncbi:hypothetical protein FACS1894186_6770 [Alphaproteobacteria bacterium]|nr:hypothetical protein FACS1894186_6770 [Alphaproteobacteria bacterium]
MRAITGGIAAAFALAALLCLALADPRSTAPRVEFALADPPPPLSASSDADALPAVPVATRARGRHAVVITGLGLDPDLTAKVLLAAPPEFGLAYSPYADDLKNQLETAAEQGREAYIMLPLPDGAYPRHDPGGLAILPTLSLDEKIARFDLLLPAGARAAGYVSEASDLWSGNRIKPLGLAYLTRPQTTVSDSLPGLEAAEAALRAVSRSALPALVFVDAKPGLVNAAIKWAAMQAEPLAYPSNFKEP